ncbi:hypothetical protein Tsubulata_049257, partial [Turnera subulata]
MREENGEYVDDFGDTLSLSDLPLNGTSSDREQDYSRENHSSTFDDQDFFEFFSEDFTASSYTNSADNIVFCGKLISYKGGEAEVGKVQGLKTTTSRPKRGKKNRTFLSKSLSFSKCTTPFSVYQEEEEAAISRQEKYSDKYDSLVKKAASPPPTSPMRSRSSWPLLALGMGRFPVVMELSDIKMRQSKQSPRRMFGAENGREMKQRSEKRGKGLWGLLSVLGCRSYQTTAV